MSLYRRSRYQSHFYCELASLAIIVRTLARLARLLFQAVFEFLVAHEGVVKIWTLEKAKNGFSEVVRRALSHEPQVVTRGRRGEDAVVVVAKSDYERLLAPRNLVEFLRDSPLAEAVAAGEFGQVTELFARQRDLGRSISFE